ncbi:MAG: hypothetical protein C5B53_00825 [Candidatus Melainabacteria bacterium]|nr:MAG: hypothetical protein C5B53_00825 [Candidatus Melainabacteria bacterium]
MYLTVSKREISAITESHPGNKALVAALAKAGPSPVDLTCLMAQYVQFNSIFGAGVAHLAGLIATRQDMFKDNNESISVLADRSYEVAAEIFFAAIDEFRRKKTHRSMAQDSLKGFVEFFKMTPAEASLRCRVNVNTSAAVRAVTEGYCFNREITDTDLFSAIGFHIGSELLADQEYNILDRYLKQEHPTLVTFLQRAGVYSWVAVHTTVEADHCDAALQCANSALSFYTGDVSKAYGFILKGLKHFAKVQARFMHSLSATGCAEPEREAFDI